jgi:hypothetical protein
VLANAEAKIKEFNIVVPSGISYVRGLLDRQQGSSNHDDSDYDKLLAAYKELDDSVNALTIVYPIEAKPILLRLSREANNEIDSLNFARRQSKYEEENISPQVSSDLKTLSKGIQAKTIKSNENMVYLLSGLVRCASEQLSEDRYIDGKTFNICMHQDELVRKVFSR